VSLRIFTETMFAYRVRIAFLFHVPRNRCPFGALFVICQLAAHRIFRSRRARRAQRQIIFAFHQGSSQHGPFYFWFHKCTDIWCQFFPKIPLKKSPQKRIFPLASSRTPSDGVLPVRRKLKRTLLGFGFCVDFYLTKSAPSCGSTPLFFIPRMQRGNPPPPPPLPFLCRFGSPQQSFGSLF
jgi:hypothetical protein